MHNFETLETDKIALVTGAAQGIGQAIAERFVESGATVVFSDRNHEGVEKAALRAGSKHFKKLDVTDDNELEVRIREIISELGRIDILVNNAGVLPRLGTRAGDVSDMSLSMYTHIHLIRYACIR